MSLFSTIDSLLSSSTSADQVSANVALRDGRQIVVWQQTGSDADLVARYLDALGNPIGPQFTISAATNSQIKPDVTATDDGGFIVVWADNRANSLLYDVYGRVYDAAGNGGSEFLLTTDATAQQNDPSVAFLPANAAAGLQRGFMATWSDTNPLTTGIPGIGGTVLGRGFTLSGTAATGGTAFVVSANDLNLPVLGGGGSYNPAVAANGSTVAFAWSDDLPGLGNVETVDQRVDTRVGGTAQQRLTTEAVAHQQNAEIALTSAGARVVVWEDERDLPATGRDISIAINGVRSQVNTTAGDSNTVPKVAASPFGGFLVVWTHTFNTSQSDVYGRFYDAAGNAVGTDFILSNSGATSAQVEQDPAVSATIDGRYLVTWNATGANSDQDIFRQILDPRTAGIVFNGQSLGEAVVGTDYVDSLSGGGGNDGLYGGAGDDFLQGGVGADAMYGGAGSDAAVYSAAASGVAAWLALSGLNTGEAAGDTYTSIESLVGSAFDDTLSGNNLSNALAGGGGNDNILGEGGNDIIFGGAGNDSIIGQAGDDILWGEDSSGAAPGADGIDGGDGNDSILGQGGNDILLGGLGNDAIAGGADNDSIFGGDGNDAVLGGSGNDAILGENGDDILFGDDVDVATVPGDDVIDGGEGNDMILGQGGNDYLTGGNGTDAIAGGDGNDTLYGGAGPDVIFGEAGSDLIYGGVGGDILKGGLGGDLFVYGVGDGGDVILDFNAGGDRDAIDLRPLFDTTGYTGLAPRQAGILGVVQNGADTDVYVNNAFLVRLQNITASALDDSYFIFQ